LLPGLGEMSGDQYRIRAAELHAQAKTETRQAVRDELERLALSYLRLADQADQNELIDVAYETPTRPAVQQQQQIQAKDEDAEK
jgi:hypothetical protein